jgi:hypothetical protein
VVALAAVALVAVRCGGASGEGSDGHTWTFDVAPEVQPDVVDVAGDPVDKPDLPSIPDGEEPSCEAFFLEAPGVPITVPIGTLLGLTVKVVSYDTNGVAVGYPVTFTLEPPADEIELAEGQKAGELTTSIAVTNEKGEAKVNFKSGTKAEQEYLITAWTDCSLPIQQKVYVSDVPTGDLEVVLKNGSADPVTGDVALVFNTINVWLLQGSYFRCEDLHATMPPTADEVMSGPLTVGSISQTVKFPHLATSGAYTVFATAKGPNGHLAGSGCLEEITLQPDKNNKRTVVLNILQLNPTGTYAVTNEFDFTDAIPGEVGEIINLITDLFYDPGTFIFDMVIKVIKMYFGEIWGTIAETIINPFKSYLAQLITDWFLNNSPDWVQCFFVVGQDVTQIVRRAELIGDMKLYKVVGDQVNGEEEWHGLNINWALGCQQQGPCAGVNFQAIQDLCAYDADKDKCVCPVDLTQLSDFPGDFVAGKFNAFISDFDQLLISSHEVQINYGKLILWVINDLIIKYVTNGQYDSIEDVLHSIIDCASIANGMIGDLLENLGISSSQLQGFCDGAVGILINPIEEILGALHFNTSLWLNGGCTLLDQTDDLIVDKLIDGFWIGAMQIDGQVGSQFKGTFQGVRKTIP